MRRIVLFVTALLLGVVVPTASPTYAAPRCFPETGHCIDGRFREYWEQNGGLAVFGFPVSSAQNEVNADTGQTYLTQWFERNRFELHPENARPYDVLLGRLGNDRLLQQGRQWQSFPKAAPSSPHYFAETGHAIAEVFWGYWSGHGLEFDGQRGTSFSESLALFGLPLSEAAMETNSSGDTVLTQWFERARFEYHPNNPEPYKVLLGLLGNEVRGSGEAPPPPPPAPTPAPPPPSYNNCQADPRAAEAPNHPIRIVSVDKRDEVVVLQNVGTTAIDLNGWRMCSITGNQLHQPIAGLINPGETRSFPNAGGPIWNNSSEDDGALYDPQGRLISYWND